MGALHEGHISLIKRARKENDIVAVSIFVNPTQFGKNEDFNKYPKTLREDKRICRQNGVDIIFVPEASQIYKKGHATSIDVAEFSDILCGLFRPGHFKGVATIVLKLFNIIQPAKAYFGLKDYQQLKIIKKMVEDLNLPVKIVACPTVREKSGLALSSRNKFLTLEQKKSAAGIYSALKRGKSAAKSGKVESVAVLKKNITEDLKKISGLRMEYVEVVNPKTLQRAENLKKDFRILAAVRLGKTRLTDNV